MFGKNLISTFFILLIGIGIGLGINIYTIQVPKVPIISEIEQKYTIPKQIVKKQIVVNNKIISQNKIKNKKIKTKQKKENIDSIEQFKTLLLRHKYKMALSLYENKSNNDNLEKYHKILFIFIEKEVSKKNLKVEGLINDFLNLEYDNPYALYYLSKIRYIKKDYEKSILLLFKITETYTNETLKQLVIKELNENIFAYLDILDKEKELQKMQSFLLILQEKEPENYKYKYALAKLYFDLKYYEKAKYLFEEIASNELYENNILEYIKTINKKLKIKEKFTQKINLEKRDTHFFINALINETIQVKLLIDTGASLTLIDENIFKEVELNSLESINLNTANGVVQAKVTNVESFSINDFKFNDFKISISSLNSDFDGLLGMNYLKNFDFYIDQEEAVLYLNPI